jgi:hypothetical protein
MKNKLCFRVEMRESLFNNWNQASEWNGTKKSSPGTSWFIEFYPIPWDNSTRKGLFSTTEWTSITSSPIISVYQYMFPLRPDYLKFYCCLQDQRWELNMREPWRTPTNTILNALKLIEILIHLLSFAMKQNLFFFVQDMSSISQSIRK